MLVACKASMKECVKLLQYRLDSVMWLSTGLEHSKSFMLLLLMTRSVTELWHLKLILLSGQGKNWELGSELRDCRDV